MGSYYAHYSGICFLHSAINAGHFSIFGHVNITKQSPTDKYLVYLPKFAITNSTTIKIFEYVKYVHLKNDEDFPVAVPKIVSIYKSKQEDPFLHTLTNRKYHQSFTLSHS